VNPDSSKLWHFNPQATCLYACDLESSSDLELCIDFGSSHLDFLPNLVSSTIVSRAMILEGFSAILRADAALQGFVMQGRDVALPHIGSATHETRLAMVRCAVDNLIEVLSGRPSKSFLGKLRSMFAKPIAASQEKQNV
jgi:hypothetical protein